MYLSHRVKKDLGKRGGYYGCVGYGEWEGVGANSRKKSGSSLIILYARIFRQLRTRVLSKYCGYLYIIIHTENSYMYLS